MFIGLPVNSLAEKSGRVAKSVDPDQTPRSAASDLGLNDVFIYVLFLG